MSPSRLTVPRVRGSARAALRSCSRCRASCACARRARTNRSGAVSQRWYRGGSESMKLQYSYYCRAGEQVGRNWQLRAQDRVDADMHAERRCRSPVAEQLVRTPLNAASPRPRDARNAASLIAGRRRPSPTQQQPPRHLPRSRRRSLSRRCQARMGRTRLG